MPSSFRATLGELISIFAAEVIAMACSSSIDEIVAEDGHTPADGHRRRPSTSLSARVTDATRQWATRYRLTEVEEEILRRAALGQTRRQIAKDRGCSEATVKKHVANMLPRMGDASLQGALVRLLREVASERT
jgi:DNA-binding NarL/FixJ family response regulator